LIELIVGPPEVALTATDTEAETVPPAPVQLSAYVCVPIAAGVADCDPLVALAPIQSLSTGDDVAVHVAAFVLDHISVTDCPSVIGVVGATVNVTVGAAAPFTVTDTDAIALPPAPLHVRVYICVPVAPGVADCDPLVAFAPVQSLSDGKDDAVHDVALMLDHVSVTDCPSVIGVVGATVNVTVGAAAPFTVTDTDAIVLPPAPLHVNVYVSVPVAAGVADCDPLVVFAPDQSLSTGDDVAVHVVAFVLDHVKVTDCPRVIGNVGAAVNVTVGAAGAFTVTDTDAEIVPPAPVQPNVYVCVPVVPGVADCDPLVAFAPVQSLSAGEDDAVHDVALVLDHVKVADCPRVIGVVGATVSVTVGAGDPFTVTLTDCIALPPAPAQLNV
jgi:hypothetical protein